MGGTLATDRSETAAEAAARTGIPDGTHLALAAGERLELCDGLTLAHHARQAIFAGCGEMVVHDRVHHHRTWHFQLPSQESDPDKPTVNSVVATFIRKKPIGWRSLGTHFLCFLAADNSLLECVDNSMDYGTNSSGTWEFNYDELGVLCRSVGVSFRIERFEMASEFIATGSSNSAWIPPVLRAAAARWAGRIMFLNQVAWSCSVTPSAFASLRSGYGGGTSTSEVVIVNVVKGSRAER